MIDTQAIRSKILDLAMRGQLTEQLPEEGTAEELYQQILEEKQKLIKEGKIKKQKPLPEISDEEIPFDIPKRWKWVRLGNLISIESGRGLTASNMNPGYFPVYGGNGIAGYHNCGFVPSKTIVIGRVGYNCGSVHITEKEAWVTDNAFITSYPEKHIDKFYLAYTLQHMKLGQNNNGAAQPVVSGKKIYPLAFPLPPLAEQKRIVEKIDQAFSVLDTIDKLQAPYADNLTALKSKLIDAAIQGKLTEQLPEDGTAEELYQQIQEEKQRLLNEGEIYREKSLKPIIDKEIPFDIPNEWKWCKLGELTKLITKGSSPSWQGVSYTTEDKGILFVTSENVGNKKMLLKKRKYVEAKFNDMHRSSILQKGDLLTNIVGASIGRTAVFNEDIKDANINQAVSIIRLVDSSLTDYLLLYLNSSAAIVNMTEKTVDFARANLSLTSVTNLIVPLPPLAEQKRIVQKLDEILPLCEQLVF